MAGFGSSEDRGKPQGGIKILTPSPVGPVPGTGVAVVGRF